MANKQPEKQNVPMPDEVREFFRKAGAEGGKIGAKRRWKGHTKKERSAAASAAARARWAKRNTEPA